MRRISMFEVGVVAPAVGPTINAAHMMGNAFAEVYKRSTQLLKVLLPSTTTTQPFNFPAAAAAAECSKSHSSL